VEAIRRSQSAKTPPPGQGRKTSDPISSGEAPAGNFAAMTPPAARFLPRRTFYGWYIAIGCLIMQFVTVGVGYYGLQVFLKPLRDEHGWSASVVSSASGLFFAVAGISSFVVGRYLDRLGPVRFLYGGIALISIGTFGLGFVHAIWQLFACYTIMAIAFGGGGGVAVSSLLTKWFISKRAQALSVASTGVSLGGAVLVPVGTALIASGGLRRGAPILGILVAVIALPVLWATIAATPESMGLNPDGTDDETAARRRHESAAGQYTTWTRAEAARTMPFWAILIGFALALAAQTGVLIHQLAFLQGTGQLGSRSAAAFAVTTTTIGSIVARLIVGSFADRADKVRLAVAFVALQALTAFSYTMLHNRLGLYVAALIFGFTVGNVYMLQALVTGEVFGLVSYGTIYGVISLAGSLGSACGLFFTGWALDWSNGYTVPFRVLAIVNALAAVVVSFAHHPLAATAIVRPDVVV
jgi:sugar phosphate permease